MATLTTSYQYLGQAYLGKSGGSLYVRIYAKYSQQDITNNRSLVQYQARAYFENGSYIYDSQGSGSVSGTSASSVSGSCTRPTVGETVIATTEGWVTHNSDGTKIISCSASLSFPNWGWSNTASGSATIPTIPRASSISCSGGNIGSSTKISISRASSSFTHTISYSFGSLSGTIATKTSSTSIDWTIPTSFYAQIPNSNTGTITLICQTYNGNTLIGTKTTTCIAKVTNSNPIFESSQLTYLDSDSDIVAITENNQHIVRNSSNLKVSFTGATAQNSAAISSYEIVFNNTTQIKTEASTIDYGKINLSNNSIVSVKVTDSRGNTTTIQKEIIILDWKNPTATISVGRVNNYEDDTKINVAATISNVNNKNVIESIICKYKKTSDELFNNQTELTNYTEKTITIDKLYAWDFKIIITDKFGSTTYNFKIAKGTPIMFIDTKKLAIGVNSFPTNSKEINIDGDLRSNGNILTELISPYDYTNNDLVKIREYIQEIGTLTDDEINKYDIDKNGLVNTRDYVIIKSLIDNGIDTTHSAKLKLKRGETPAELSYVWEDASGSEIVNIGLNGFYYQGNPIIGSGNNENGDYIKFANGIMICSKTISGRTTFSLWANNIYFKDIANGDWAEEFTELWNVQVTNTTAATWANIYNCSLTSAGTSRISRPDSGGSNGQYYNVNIIAIGRWK